MTMLMRMRVDLVSIRSCKYNNLCQLYLFSKLPFFNTQRCNFNSYFMDTALTDCFVLLLLALFFVS